MRNFARNKTSRKIPNLQYILLIFKYIYSQLSSGERGLKFSLSLCLRFYVCLRATKALNLRWSPVAWAQSSIFLLPIFSYASILKIKISNVLVVSY